MESLTRRIWGSAGLLRLRCPTLAPGASAGEDGGGSSCAAPFAFALLAIYDGVGKMVHHATIYTTSSEHVGMV